MDWEDEYTRSRRAHLAEMIERAHNLGKTINHEQYTTILDKLNHCRDFTCSIDGSLKELCFDCKSSYKTADKQTRKFIKLEIQLQEQEY